MARLIYTSIVSLDGFVADLDNRFDWARPDEEVHGFVNDLERPIGTYLLGRRMFEVMRVWESIGREPDDPPVIRDYARVWTGADKIVFSSSLRGVDTARTRIERQFDPEAVRDLVRGASRDLGIGGAELAAQALAANLVDEIRLIVAPVLVGGGKPGLPAGIFLQLGLADMRRFSNGMVFLRYQPVR